MMHKYLLIIQKYCLSSKRYTYRRPGTSFYASLYYKHYLLQIIIYHLFFYTCFIFWFLWRYSFEFVKKLHRLSRLLHMLKLKISRNARILWILFSRIRLIAISLEFADVSWMPCAMNSREGTATSTIILVWIDFNSAL